MRGHLARIQGAARGGVRGFCQDLDASPEVRPAAAGNRVGAIEWRHMNALFQKPKSKPLSVARGKEGIARVTLNRGIA